ncbi:hypothetical protein [Sphingobacterium sp. UBA6320]|jgi:hypothetical protein|uniref:hypothetical protein n=1 Tax=Sphingobacterium sp. UBA6320 TaxID=1947510 RepID=UPI0025E2AEF4|nr:hypothetical protein [Sphingobacterium sp. UBA6320]
MNQDNKRKKKYIQPKIEMILIEMENCLAAGPICLFPVSSHENKNLIELKIIK